MRKRRVARVMATIDAVKLVQAMAMLLKRSMKPRRVGPVLTAMAARLTAAGGGLVAVAGVAPFGVWVGPGSRGFWVAAAKIGRFLPRGEKGGFCPPPQNFFVFWSGSPNQVFF